MSRRLAAAVPGPRQQAAAIGTHLRNALLPKVDEFQHVCSQRLLQPSGAKDLAHLRMLATAAVQWPRQLSALAAAESDSTRASEPP